MMRIQPSPPVPTPRRATGDASAAPRRSRWARIKSVREQPWWPWFKRALTLVFFGLVAWLIIDQARAIDWSQVGDSVRQRSWGTLGLAALLAATSHLIYSSFDLFGRHVTGHRLPKLRVMATTFVSYTFNLNLGALIGGMAFRYRLYSRQGIGPEKTTTILATSMLTNWLGYALLGGLVLLVAPPALPQDWAIDGAPLRLVGALMVAVGVGWQLACMLSKRREFHIRSQTIALPGARLAALQLLASALNWAVIASVIYVLFEQRVDYTSALSTLLIAAVAGVIAHVPAGIGVLEAVFVGLLGGQLPTADIIGALLLYRAMYYLMPLAIAIPMQWRLEATAEEAKQRLSSTTS